jgi:hypothetical protein
MKASCLVKMEDADPSAGEVTQAGARHCAKLIPSGGATFRDTAPAGSPEGRTTETIILAMAGALWATLYRMASIGPVVSTARVEEAGGGSSAVRFGYSTKAVRASAAPSTARMIGVILTPSGR